MPATDPRTCHHGGLLDFCPYCSPQRYWPVNQQPVTIAPGWACRCGRVFNPDVRECPYCPQQKHAGGGISEFSLYHLYDGDPGPVPMTGEPASNPCPCQPSAEGGLCGCGEDADEPAGPCTSVNCTC